jgi:hypothetical protein
MRDPALAALLGALPGSNFGTESDFGAEFGDDVGDDMGDDMGDDYGAEFGDDYGAEFGAAALTKPSPQAALAAWRALRAKRGMTQHRGRLLEPNKGSAVKVERYAFTISQAITLGVATAFTTLTGQPDTTIRPQRVTMNAPTPMFAFIQEIKVANVSVTVGSGLEDAFNYNANGVGASLDMPTLSPANRATVLGAYTGFVPPGFVGGTPVNFSVSFRGPASIVA